MQNICRTCLKRSETLLPLFDENHLSQKIETISSVIITETDNLPTKVCIECVTNINLCYNFRSVIINSDVELKQRLCTVLDEKEINKKEPDTVQFDQINVKTECEGFRDDYFLTEGIAGVPKDTLHEDMEVKIKTEAIGHMEEENVVRVNEVSKPSLLKKPSSNFPKNTSLKTQPSFKDHAKYSNHRRNVSKSMCSICGKSVRTDNLKKHISIHTEPPVPCKVCGKICKNSESLRSHVLIHKGLETTCEFCGKSFRYRGGYKRHVLKKHMEGASRRAKCHLCEKTFYDNAVLKKHLRSHTGERPYLCEYCKKGFSSSHALKTHIRQHTNERPYTCEFCPMAFPQKVSLRTHTKSKHSTLVKNIS